MTGHPDEAVALYYVDQGYTTAGRELMGIQAAQQGLLGGFARHGGMAEFSALVDSGTEGEAFRRAVRQAAPAQPSGWMHRGQAPRLASIGTLLLPGPGLHDFAWSRHRAGDRHAFAEGEGAERGPDQNDDADRRAMQRVGVGLVDPRRFRRQNGDDNDGDRRRRNTDGKQV